MDKYVICNCVGDLIACLLLLAAKTKPTTNWNMRLEPAVLTVEKEGRTISFENVFAIFKRIATQGCKNIAAFNEINKLF